MNQTQTVFTEGMRVYKPSEEAPEFIIANIDVFDVDKFCAWLQENKRPSGGARLTIKESTQRADGSGGNFYTVLDTYVSETERTNGVV